MYGAVHMNVSINYVYTVELQKLELIYGAVHINISINYA